MEEINENKFKKYVNIWARIFWIGWKHLLTLNLKITLFLVFVTILLFGAFFMNDSAGYVTVDKSLVASKLIWSILGQFIWLNVGAFLSCFILKNARDEFYRRDNKSLQKQLRDIKKGTI